MKQELSKISVFRFEAFRNTDAESNIELVRDSLQVVEAHSLPEFSVNEKSLKHRSH